MSPFVFGSMCEPNRNTPKPLKILFGSHQNLSKSHKTPIWFSLFPQDFYLAQYISIWFSHNFFWFVFFQVVQSKKKVKKKKKSFEVGNSVFMFSRNSRILFGSATYHRVKPSSRPLVQRSTQRCARPSAGTPTRHHPSARVCARWVLVLAVVCSGLPPPLRSVHRC